ncbi:flagellar brake protein [Aestuariirhabdus sp. LZHN29]|uniref:flagellar brake protein n=1 Tax=Aestuariirhabdus sp. LZHN29 TaxID=3417462 RepID=UPI003CE88BC6
MDSKDNFRLLTNPREIGSYLIASCERKEAVTLYFPAQEQGYRSLFIAIDTDQGEIELDSMAPTPGDQLIRDQQRFHVIGSVSGVQLRFDDNVLDRLTLDQQGNAGYRIKFPAKARYMQRRDAFRARIQQSVHVKVVLEDDELPHPIMARLVDISATGCRVLVKQANLKGTELNSGAGFSSLRFQIPGSMEVDTTVLVRNILVREELQDVQIGFEYCNLSGINERYIDRFVNQLQRDSRHATD